MTKPIDMPEAERLAWVEVFTAEGIDPHTVMAEPIAHNPLTGQVHYVAKLRNPDGTWKMDHHGLVKEHRTLTPTNPLPRRLTRTRRHANQPEPPAPSLTTCGIVKRSRRKNAPSRSPPNEAGFRISGAERQASPHRLHRPGTGPQTLRRSGRALPYEHTHSPSRHTRRSPRRRAGTPGPARRLPVRQ